MDSMKIENSSHANCKEQATFVRNTSFCIKMKMYGLQMDGDGLQIVHGDGLQTLGMNGD